MLTVKYKKTGNGINGTYIEQQRTEDKKVMLLLNDTIVDDRCAINSVNKQDFMCFNNVIKRQGVRGAIKN